MGIPPRSPLRERFEDMTMRRSTKAKRLKVAIAYYILSGRKRPKAIVTQKSWYSESKVWHVRQLDTPKPIKPHCNSCECLETKTPRMYSLCGLFSFDPNHWRYRDWGFSEDDFEGRRPCKKCMKQLSILEHEDDRH